MSIRREEEELDDFIDCNYDIVVFAYLFILLLFVLFLRSTTFTMNLLRVKLSTVLLNRFISCLIAYLIFNMLLIFWTEKYKVV